MCSYIILFFWFKVVWIICPQINFVYANPEILIYLEFRINPLKKIKFEMMGRYEIRKRMVIYVVFFTNIWIVAYQKCQKFHNSRQTCQRNLNSKIKGIYLFLKLFGYLCPK